MDYMQDNRTKEEMKANYDMGKEKEDAIIKHLKDYGIVYEANQKDEWLKHWKYCPDCVAMISGHLIPLEIKYTTHNMKEVQRKKNQYLKAKKYWGWLLCVANNGFCLLKSEKQWEYIEKWYCNKPCIIMTDFDWLPKSKLKLIFKTDLSEKVQLNANSLLQ